MFRNLMLFHDSKYRVDVCKFNSKSTLEMKFCPPSNIKMAKMTTCSVYQQMLCSTGDSADAQHFSNLFIIYYLCSVNKHLDFNGVEQNHSFYMTILTVYRYTCITNQMNHQRNVSYQRN
jgi:hypothetical protein